MMSESAQFYVTFIKMMADSVNLSNLIMNLTFSGKEIEREAY